MRPRQAVARLKPDWACAQRESFDVIGLVGFGKDMGASRNIFDASASDTFKTMGEELTELIRRVLNPLRAYLTFLPVRALPVLAPCQR